MEQDKKQEIIAEIGDSYFYCFDPGFSFIELYNNIEQGSPDAKSFLQLLSQYGLLDELIPIIEIVYALGSEKAKAWISDVMLSLSEPEFIRSSLRKYHNIVVDSYMIAKKVNRNTLNDEQLWKVALSMSAAQKESFVWSSYDQQYLPRILKDSDKCIGLLAPGLFSSTPCNGLFSKISRFTITAIERTIDYRRHYDANNTILTAIIKREICILVNELAHLYFSTIDSAIPRFLELSTKSIREMTGMELKKQVFTHNPKKASLYDYNNLWVESIKRICQCSEEFFSNDKPQRTTELLSYIPLLYQLINENRCAEKELVNWLREYGYYSSSALLMSSSIALLKGNNSPELQFIRSCTDNYYGNQSEQIKRYTALLSDTIQYFRALFQRISTMIDKMDDMVYQSLSNTLERDIKLGRNILGDQSIIWIYENMIVGDRFIVKFNQCIDRIQTAKHPLIDADAAFKQSLSLFFSVSGHLDNCPRINTKCYLRGLKDSDYSKLSSEVFYDESYYDSQEHQALYRRFVYMLNTLPSKKFTEHAIDVLKESVYDDIDLTQEFLSACEKICNDPCNYATSGEDGLNRHVRDLLNASLFRLGYIVYDQTQQGYGRKGKKPGEVDIRINKGQTQIALYEGLTHKSYDYLYNHIDKVINRYNPVGCQNIYVVEFTYNSNFNIYWQRTLTLLNKHPLISVAEEKQDSLFIRRCEGQYKINGVAGHFVFIGVRLKKH